MAELAAEELSVAFPWDCRLKPGCDAVDGATVLSIGAAEFGKKDGAESAGIVGSAVEEDPCVLGVPKLLAGIAAALDFAVEVADDCAADSLPKPARALDANCRGGEQSSSSRCSQTALSGELSVGSGVAKAPETAKVMKTIDAARQGSEIVLDLMFILIGTQSPSVAFKDDPKSAIPPCETTCSPALRPRFTSTPLVSSIPVSISLS